MSCSTKPNTALRRDPNKPLPNEQDMRQERAEIQNIVVVRHWSLVDLRRLYELAEKEAAQPTQIPPQNLQEGVELPVGDPRLSITGPKNDGDLSKAHPKPIELSLSRLDASMKKAVNRPKILHSPGDNVVDVLLDEWTQLGGFGSQSRHHHHKGHRYQTSYQTDEDDDDLEPGLERAKGIGGQYIQGPTNGNKRNVKSVHFRARVESGSEGSDKAKQQLKKPPSRHVLRSEASFSSLTSSSASSDFSDLTPPPTPTARTAPDRGPKDAQSSSSRRYTPPNVPPANGPEGITKSERRTPPSPIYSRPMPVQHNQSWQGGGGVGSYPSGNQPDFHGGPHSPHQQTRPTPIQNQSWQGGNQFSNNNNNLPIHPMQQYSQQQHHPKTPHRAASVSGPIISPPYGSPIPHGSPIPPPSLHGGRLHAFSHPQPQLPSSLQQKPQASGGYNSNNNGNNNYNSNFNNQSLPPSRHRSERRHRTPREKRGEGGSGRSSGIGSREGKNILKKSLISAGAVAGLLDILDGLGAI